MDITWRVFGGKGERKNGGKVQRIRSINDIRKIRSKLGRES